MAGKAELRPDRWSPRRKQVVELLLQRGEMPMQELIIAVASSVRPEKAFRSIEANRQRMNRHDNPRRKPLPLSEQIVSGQRRIVKNMILGHVGKDFILRYEGEVRMVSLNPAFDWERALRECR